MSILRVATIGMLIIGTIQVRDAAAQTMSFSIYTNASIGSNGRVYADVTGVDGSSGCSHWNYGLDTEIVGPSGSASGSGWSHASASLLDGEGDYTITSTIGLNCSCMQGTYNTVAGDGIGVNKTKFRAVWSYSHPNGSQHEYGGMCIHSCQPSRVCIPDNTNFAFMEGWKLITPVVSVCQPSTPVIPSTSYYSNSCIGSGSFGFSGGFDDHCDF